MTDTLKILPLGDPPIPGAFNTANVVPLVFDFRYVNHAWAAVGHRLAIRLEIDGNATQVEVNMADGGKPHPLTLKSLADALRSMADKLEGLG